MRSIAKSLSLLVLVAVTAVAWNVDVGLAQAADAKAPAAAAPASSASSDQAATQHASELTAASAEYAKASGAAKAESDKKLAAAQAAYDAATKKARDAYQKSLEKDLEREVKANNQAGADAVRQKIDFLLNGPPRNEVQKLWIASFTAENNKEYEAAIAAVEKVVQTANSGKNAFVQMRLGWLHYLDEDYEEAIAAYKTSIEIAPKAITPRQGLLNCYLALNKTDDAIEAAHAILKLDPLNIRANKTLGDLYYVKGDFTRSGAHFQRLTVAYPDDLQLATNLGWCYLKLDEKELALRIFSNVLAVQPDSISAISGYTAASSTKDDSAKTSQPEVASAKIVIRNPATTGRAVRYTLNGQYPVTLEPGTAQTLEPGRTWTIRFQPGTKARPVQQRLEPGHYEFTSDKERTQLSRR
jgi:tetratricopeptide (TPR) repeat protein